MLKPFVRWSLARLLRSGMVLVQNRDDERLLLDLGIPASHVRRIAGAGVDLQLFRVCPEPEGLPVVVLPSRLLWQKGVGEFVAAARLLRDRGRSARFVLVGAPDSANPSSVPADRIREWMAEGVVEYRGWVEDMPRVLAESSIVCLPSYYGEGIPKSLIEAVAAGRPVVTTDSPGCREVVHDNVNGLLVPPRDPGALADALDRLLGDAQLRHTMGRKGRLRAEQEFALESVVRETLATYTSQP